MLGKSGKTYTRVEFAWPFIGHQDRRPWGGEVEGASYLITKRIDGVEDPSQPALTLVK